MAALEATPNIAGAVTRESRVGGRAVDRAAVTYRWATAWPIAPYLHQIVRTGLHL